MSGPGVASFDNPTLLTPSVTMTQAGVYLFQLTARDAQTSASSITAVTVNASTANQPPVVSTGPNQTIQLPTNVVALHGTVMDDGLPVGGVLTSSWSLVSGPAPVQFTNGVVPDTTAAVSQAGTYVLRLTASDSQLVSSADVTITVLTRNLPPVVSAGPNQSIAYPGTSTTLNGSATDDGLPVGSTLTSFWSVEPAPDSWTPPI